ncbi:hypothetical protein [Pseudoalteromonas luteoviolacea]|uniref:Uncharacterized protein n=1 Tax=Pseudoalteromonas luteoviolacea (strain 2ta16) TaxID=1353533 RepID=V4H211_PSEL2|nr:hypothetical protein [Pseudoalteromonas luteoviolacea]ESP91471.1 hypothetical protein PL2TA16_00270 [Pseudoalteromonas luteoviolacea 2ta16]KZN40120.1 hypothetical protein N483_18195 [Pseudoalteromonas luteoviolacea NCIMB 1944]
MKIISKISDPIEKADLYFGINPSDRRRPFVLGANSNAQGVLSIASWGAASTFGLENLNSIDGSMWKDWRASLRHVGCDWVIPIIEKAEKTNNLDMAVAEILQRANQE